MPELDTTPTPQRTLRFGPWSIPSEQLWLVITVLCMIGMLWLCIAPILDYRLFAIERTVAEFHDHMEDWGGYRTSLRGELYDLSELPFGLGDDQIMHAMIADETGTASFIFHREVIDELPRIGDRIRVVLSIAYYDGASKSIMAHVVDRLE